MNILKHGLMESKWWYQSPPISDVCPIKYHQHCQQTYTALIPSNLYWYTNIHM